MDKLLPCPFCGAEPEYKTESQDVPPFGMRVWIKCPQCRQSSVCSDWYGGDLGTMEASWNKRADLPNKHTEMPYNILLENAGVTARLNPTQNTLSGYCPDCGVSRIPPFLKRCSRCCDTEEKQTEQAQLCEENSNFLPY